MAIDYEKRDANRENNKKKKTTVAIIIAVIVVIALVAVIDHSVRHPKCNSQVDALNRVLQEYVQAYTDFTTDDGFGLDTDDIVEDGNARYYPVIVTKFPCIGYDENGKTIVSEEEEYVKTVYVRESNSNMYIKDETTGKFIPFEP